VVLVETLLILEAAVGEAQVVQEETELLQRVEMGGLDRLQVLLEQAYLMLRVAQAVHTPEERLEPHLLVEEVQQEPPALVQTTQELLEPQILVEVLVVIVALGLEI
jgi:hypothetical protein